MNEIMENGVVEVVEGVVEDSKNRGISWKSAGIGAGIAMGAVVLVRFAAIPFIRGIKQGIALYRLEKDIQETVEDDEIIDEDEIEVINPEKD